MWLSNALARLGLALPESDPSIDAGGLWGMPVSKLGIDSLAMSELLMEIEEAFDLTITNEMFADDPTLLEVVAHAQE